MEPNYLPRSVETYVFDETLTGRHMVFLAGPRQVGKTRLARHWLSAHDCPSLYFNWDDPAIRQAYRANSRFFESPARSVGVPDPWIVFDEIHKRNQWRDILKGAYDLFSDDFRFLITGSARLDLFRRAGDSLVGRYNLFHMMPLNIAEAAGGRRHSCFLEESDAKKMAGRFHDEISRPVSKEIVETFENLWAFGPFPEPFLRQNKRFCRKWHQDYVSLLVREDLREISRVVELDKVETLVTLLPSRLMSPLSMSNIARDLEVAHTTVKNWLEQLKRLYLAFPVSPWSKKIPRGLKKDKKWYFIDWYYASSDAARLENMVATNLYRTCLTLTDMGFGDYRLHFVRTLDKREIDFIVTNNHKPLMAVEVKTGDTVLSGPLRDRRNWFPDTALIGVQVVNRRGVLQKYPDDTWVVSVERLLSLLI